MLPKFLQPEALLYASLELIRTRIAEAVQLARVPCAWCPDFNGADPSHRGQSHGMCATCAALFEQAIDADRENEDADDRDEFPGSTCGPACGYCGRCS